MTTFVDAHPVARTRHRCGVCYWWIEPGETYWRQAALDGATAWTNKTCEHCQRVASAYCRDIAEDEWDQEACLEWLSDYHPAVFAGMRTGWSFPDGARMAPPFEPRCVDCGGPHPQMRGVWCIPCDDARLPAPAATEAEHDAIAGVLADCQGQALPGPPQPATIPPLPGETEVMP